MIERLFGERWSLRGLQQGHYADYSRIGNLASGFLLLSLLNVALVFVIGRGWTSVFVFLLLANTLFFHRLTLAVLYPAEIRSGREADRQELLRRFG